MPNTIITSLSSSIFAGRIPRVPFSPFAGSVPHARYYHHFFILLPPFDRTCISCLMLGSSSPPSRLAPMTSPEAPFALTPSPTSTWRSKGLSLTKKTSSPPGKQSKTQTQASHRSVKQLLHSDSGHLEIWTKIFHCPTSSGASE